MQANISNSLSSSFVLPVTSWFWWASNDALNTSWMEVYLWTFVEFISTIFNSYVGCWDYYSHANLNLLNMLSTKTPRWWVFLYVNSIFFYFGYFLSYLLRLTITNSSCHSLFLHFFNLSTILGCWFVSYFHLITSGCHYISYLSHVTCLMHITWLKTILLTVVLQCMAEAVVFHTSSPWKQASKLLML